MILDKHIYLSYTYADLHMRTQKQNQELTYQGMLYWVRGVSFFHEMALNVNTLAQALNSLEDDNPLMISGLLLRSALNRKSALDIAIDNESPKSVELML